MDLPYQIPLGKGVKVLDVHPVGLLALEKPEGLLSTPNSEKDLDKTLIRAKFNKKKEAYVWFDAEQVQRYLYICHRLDSHTSGVLLFTFEEVVAMEVRKLFKRKEIQKEYYAVIAGVPKASSGKWVDELKNSNAQKKLRTRVARGGDSSVTNWEVIKTRKSPFLSLIAMRPLTGRTHQLRVQTSSRHMGIVGDRTYGDFKVNARIKREFKVKRLCLHAHRLNVESTEFLGGKIKFEVVSKVPPTFFQLFDKAHLEKK